MPAEVYSRLGEAIRRRRDEKGLSQAALGLRVGLGRTSITNIEKGVQSLLLHQFLEIADAVETSPEEILQEIGSKPPRDQADEGDRLGDLLLRLDRRGLGR